MKEVDIKTLFKAGAHFGHKTSRWHPKMQPYIHSKRAGVHIINLEITVEKLSEAQKFIEQVASEGRQILLVGTKKQAADIIENAAKKIDQPYVNKRWFGGLLTNYKTISERVKHLKKLEEQMESGELTSRYNKLEVQRFQEEIDKMNDDFGGIKNMQGLPGALFVVDVVEEELAVREANKLGIPVVAIVDTNANPELVQYPIPANDDSIKTIELITEAIVSAYEEGQQKRAKKVTEKKSSTKKEDK